MQSKHLPTTELIAQCLIINRENPFYLSLPYEPFTNPQHAFNTLSNRLVLSNNLTMTVTKVSSFQYFKRAQYPARIPIHARRRRAQYNQEKTESLTDLNDIKSAPRLDNSHLIMRSQLANQGVMAKRRPPSKINSMTLNESNDMELSAASVSGTPLNDSSHSSSEYNSRSRAVRVLPALPPRPTQRSESEDIFSQHRKEVTHDMPTYTIEQNSSSAGVMLVSTKPLPTNESYMDYNLKTGSAAALDDGSLLGSDLGCDTESNLSTTSWAGASSGWSVDRVAQWLLDSGVPQLEQLFRVHNINGAALHEMDTNKYKSMGITGKDKAAFKKALHDLKKTMEKERKTQDKEKKKDGGKKSKAKSKNPFARF